MTRFILLLIVGAFITGCSSAPKDDYALLLQKKPEHILNSPKDAIGKTTATLLELGKHQVAEIRLTNPAMKLDDTWSNFVVYETPILKIGSYSLNVSTGCYECAGFRKKTLLPYVLLTNAKKEKAPSIDKKNRIPFGYHINKLFDVLEEAKYYILISADNRSLGESFLATATTYYNGGQLTVPMGVQVSPEGNASITLSLIE